jgi:hypothetical protein
MSAAIAAFTVPEWTETELPVGLIMPHSSSAVRSSLGSVKTP